MTKNTRTPDRVMPLGAGEKSHPKTYGHPWLTYVVRKNDNDVDAGVVKVMSQIALMERQGVEITKPLVDYLIDRERLETNDLRNMMEAISDRSVHQPPRKRSSKVYILQWGDRIKIGTAVHVESRVRSLSLNPDCVRLVLQGGHALERQLHKRFEEHRIAGSEWFNDNPDIQQFIAEHL